LEFVEQKHQLVGKHSYLLKLGPTLLVRSVGCISVALLLLHKVRIENYPFEMGKIEVVAAVVDYSFVD
jgi:hypothetical protein